MCRGACDIRCGNFPLPLMNWSRIRNAKAYTYIYIYIRYDGVNEGQIWSCAIKVTVEASKTCRIKMSRIAVYRDRPLWPYRIIFVLFLSISLSLILRRVDANPLPDLVQEYQNLISENWTDNSTDNSVDNSTEIAANTDV